MKTETEIKDDVFVFVRGSHLAESVSGSVRKTGRPEDSSKEDIVISVLDCQEGLFQDATLNVNIYVPDIRRDNSYEEHTARIRELSKMAAELLYRASRNGYRIKLESQRVMKVSGKDEHLINNKIKYRFLND